MRRLIHIEVFVLILLFFITNESNSQLNTHNEVINRGVINLKKRVLDQKAGYIDNDSGKIVVDAPTTIIIQDTILGRVDYIFNQGMDDQYIPQIFYWDVRFTGNSRKRMVDSTKILTSMSRFVSDSVVNLDLNLKSRINIEGYITHQGKVNFGISKGLVSLVGRNAQDIDGKGLFKELELNNKEGADVINGGGFRVNTSLELIKGEFRNLDTNNFFMLGDSKIIRWSGASLLSEAKWDSMYSVHYKGDSAIISGNEIPKSDTTVILDLIVENIGGLTLDRNVTHHRQLDLGTFINTEPDSNNRYVLTTTSDLDPIFRTANSEVIGSYRRTKLRYDNVETYFNNKYTYVLFGNRDSAGGAVEMTMRVMPKTFPKEALAFINTKVERDIFISAKDASGNPVSRGMNFVLGYGWRHIMSDPTKHETNNLNIPDIILQRWDGTLWKDNKTSEQPQVDSDGWAYARATNVTELGQFAIGISDVAQLVLRARALMEGPYRYGSMATDLQRRGLIPNRPPDIYPYNLDPKRDSNYANIIDTGIVDWVLIEFHKDSLNSGEVYYRCAFMRNDGTIVDIDGTSAVSIARGGMTEGKYYIGIRHRNHLPIFSQNFAEIFPGTEKPILDMTKPENIFGGASAMKPVGFDLDNSLLFGMVAGDVDGDGIITDKDDIFGKVLQRDDLQIWEKRDIEGYLPWDVTLSGYIHTRDINYSWNNRGRAAITP
ncbi:hypothetical protein D9V86_03490 [Bacteroidetes/Chlorobi group bacterium ChocPot_Mid]|nr:MAG: hypothetical protein D9V86_03490 [Bacteroidetes/Chlorobi group bacterium ChocPot_Mid]